MYFVFIVCFSLTLLCDQLSKFWVCKYFLPYPYGKSWVLIKEWIYITRVHNSGAAWSILQGKQLFLIGLGVMVLAGLALFRKELGAQKKSIQILLGLFTAGVCGNMLDRIKWGYVVDFIDIDLQFYRWPTFNIADMAIVIGVVAYVGWREFER